MPRKKLPAGVPAKVIEVLEKLKASGCFPSEIHPEHFLHLFCQTWHTNTERPGDGSLRDAIANTVNNAGLPNISNLPYKLAGAAVFTKDEVEVLLRALGTTWYGNSSVADNHLNLVVGKEKLLTTALFGRFNFLYCLAPNKEPRVHLIEQEGVEIVSGPCLSEFEGAVSNIFRRQSAEVALHLKLHKDLGTSVISLFELKTITVTADKSILHLEVLARDGEKYDALYSPSARRGLLRKGWQSERKRKGPRSKAPSPEERLLIYIGE